jgi:hypothetical protein
MFNPQRRAASGELGAAIKSLTAFLELCEAGLGSASGCGEKTTAGAFISPLKPSLATSLRFPCWTPNGRSQFFAATA